jgi:hypothetical protein
MARAHTYAVQKYNNYNLRADIAFSIEPPHAALRYVFTLTRQGYGVDVWPAQESLASDGCTFPKSTADGQPAH